jgi:hypothetical protein
VRILKRDIDRDIGVPPEQQILQIATRSEPLEDHEVLVRGHEVFMTIDRSGGAYRRKRKLVSSPTIIPDSKSTRMKRATIPAASRKTKRRLDPDFVSSQTTAKKAKSTEEDSDGEVDLLELLESFKFSTSGDECEEPQISQKKKRRKA